MTVTKSDFFSKEKRRKMAENKIKGEERKSNGESGRMLRTMSSIPCRTLSRQTNRIDRPMKDPSEKDQEFFDNRSLLVESIRCGQLEVISPFRIFICLNWNWTIGSSSTVGSPHVKVVPNRI